MKAFAKAVAIGALVGAGPFLVFTILFTLLSLPDGRNGPGSLWQTLYFAVLPFLIAAPIVFVASIVIGLPLTYALIRTGQERGSVYLVAGAIVGVALPSAMLWCVGAEAGYWLATWGMASGTATAWSWWRDRKRALTATNSPWPARPPHRPARS